MNEPNYLFVNLFAIVLFSSCVIVFCYGVKLSNLLILKTPRFIIHRHLKVWQLLLPLFSAVLLNLISLARLLKNNPDFLTAWFYRTSLMKSEINTEGALVEALPLLFAVLYWAIWRTIDIEKYRKNKVRLLRLSILGTGLLGVAVSVMKVARHDLIPGLFGTFFVILLHNYLTLTIKFRTFFLRVIVIVILGLGVFLLIGWLRCNQDWTMTLDTLWGYTIASYNRLAALLEGRITYPYAETGIYAFRAISHVPLLHRFLDVKEVFDMPLPQDVLFSEFPAVASTGLRPEYIWVTAFGYVFADIGLFVFPYFFVIGVVSGIIWISLNGNGTFGIVLYPWMAFSILFWFGDNFIAYVRTLTIFGTAMVLTIYERILLNLARLNLH
jgi:hypothetical protein